MRRLFEIPYVKTVYCYMLKSELIDCDDWRLIMILAVFIFYLERFFNGRYELMFPDAEVI